MDVSILLQQVFKVPVRWSVLPLSILLLGDEGSQVEKQLKVTEFTTLSSIITGIVTQ